MTTIDKEVVEKLTKLCRINCSDAEKDNIQQILGNIIGYFEQLQDVDTENVEPCNQVLEGAGNVFRPDDIGTTLPRDVFLSNAPSQVGGMIRVPPVLKAN